MDGKMRKCVINPNLKIGFCPFLTSKINFIAILSS